MSPRLETKRYRCEELGTTGKERGRGPIVELFSGDVKRA